MIDQIRDFIIGSLESMDYDVEGVTGDTVLGPIGLDLDSLAIAELAARVEDQYAVRLSNDEAEKFAVMTLDQFGAEVSQRISPVVAAEHVA
jgi:acyl carrier protein